MHRSDVARAVAGVVVWALVALLAVVMVEVQGGLWGALPVLAAVVVAWYLGERLTSGHPREPEDPS